MDEVDWASFAAILDYVPLAAGAGALRAAVDSAEQALGSETRRVHYLSVPPNAALSAVGLCGKPISSTGPESSWRSLSAPIWRAPFT